MSRLIPRLYVLGRLLEHLCQGSAWHRTRPQTPRKILVLHHLLLGDSLMLSGMLDKLQHRFPDAERFVACPQALVPLYAGNPFGINALGWNPRTREGLRPLFDKASFDLVIIPAENRFSLLARALGAHWVIGFDHDVPAWKNWLIDERHPFPESPAAFGDFCMSLIDGEMPSAFQPVQWPWSECTPFDLPVKPYAVLHPGASTRLKYWPAKRWQKLAAWLEMQGIQPIWSGDRKETELIGRLDPDGRFTSFAGRLDLGQLAHLYRGARLVVCPDTGVAHLARITGTPTVALFGPGSTLVSGPGRYWESSPFSVISHEIECRNQDITFRRHARWISRCARSYGNTDGQCSHPRCMDLISWEEVREACASRLKKN